jgi:hypothetical protein
MRFGAQVLRRLQSWVMIGHGLETRPGKSGIETVSAPFVVR